MKRFLSVLIITVFAISLVACSNKENAVNENAVDIVKNGELTAYPGKAIAKTFDKIIGAQKNDYKAKWSDITDSELGKTMSESMNQEGYNHAVSVVMNANEEQLTLIWWVNTDNGKFDLFSVNDGNELYSPTDTMVTDFFENIFN